MADAVFPRSLKLKHPCPDCGSTLDIPVNAISRPEGRNTVVVTFEVDESFIDMVSEHALFAPEQHPTFALSD